jgi:uncharacterized protein GlcG (DUF336 family)
MTFRWTVVLLSAPLFAQPIIQTQNLDGAQRAVAWHTATHYAFHRSRKLISVTNEAPAQPGEKLRLRGAGFDGTLQIFTGGVPADTSRIDEQTADFVLPAGAGGSFLQLVALTGAGRSNTASIPVDAPADQVQLSAADVQSVVFGAAMAAAGDGMVIVVVDRPGDVLAVYRRAQAQDSDVEKALSLARSGAFFSSLGTPLSSRTVRAISRVNFPENIPNQPAGDLYGIENTNRGCDFNLQYIPGQAFPRELNATASGYSLGIGTVAGGVPLFRNGETVVGGIGVAGLVSDDADEYAAAAAAQSAGFFVHLPLPYPGAVYLNGFQLPFVGPGVPAGVQPGATTDGAFQVGPLNGMPAPEGWLSGPIASPELNLDDVNGIVQNAINMANLTRAAIRLPLGTRTKMVIAVSDLNGNILALYRMSDATIFSVDVALTKARNVVYFSGPNRDPLDLPGVPLNTAVTNRTIGFGSQIYFPSGIWNTPPGPFYDMYMADIAAPCTQGHQPQNANQSGIVFFPGSSPLYRNGQMVGGLGASGDGVDNDDFVTSGGAQGYDAPAGIRADQIFIRDVRLPYWSFPRNPEE